jgi:hypothetical protein
MGAMRRDDGRGTTVKENDDSGWSSDGVVFWLGRRQNGDTIDWWGEWPMLRWPFYNSGGWELDCLRRVAGGGGVDSMLILAPIGRKRDSVAAWQHRLEERWHQGGEMEETMLVGLTQILLGRKMKKIHAVDSDATIGQWRFKATSS